jgi:fluoride exporter
VSVGDWAAVAALGGVGAIGRFLLDETIERHVSTEFPLGTFVVNLSGAFVLGLLSGAGVGGRAFLLAGTATLGSFTTFSTWMLETERLGENGEGGLAVANVVLSFVVGFLFALAGWRVGELL